MKSCKYVRTNGSGCRSRAVMESGYCYFHNPEIPDEVRRENARRGGKVKKYTGLVSRDFTKNLMGDTKMVLVETINQLRDGSMPPNVANSIIYGCSTLQKLHELQDIEQRLAELENVVEGKRVG